MNSFPDEEEFEWVKKVRCEEAFKKAFKKAYEQSYTAKSFSIATNLLKMGMEITLITQVTELSLEQVKALEDEIVK